MPPRTSYPHAWPPHLARSSLHSPPSASLIRRGRANTIVTKGVLTWRGPGLAVSASTRPWRPALGFGSGLGFGFGFGFGFRFWFGVGSGAGLDVAMRHSQHIGDGVDHLPEAAGDQVHALLPALQRLDQLPDPRREHLQRSSRRRSATRELQRRRASWTGGGGRGGGTAKRGSDGLGYGPVTACPCYGRAVRVAAVAGGLLLERVAHAWSIG